ncbi:MAG: pantoate--beta-alanine ligase [Candidatus Delongbacteria bacterium]|jgi:pantoate--beta-alanine ligase|nr:pantoate--beta-alanine ligase [Candidatus Delongbacteria bacterium]MDD4204605.1 pantoate--beta-alanine ligase [Candidatus Delongbacteria bacterium]MDY0017258.1 pantoate--beta-alanine ligase [Candidatus Delongbacteria bacterium]
MPKILRTVSETRDFTNLYDLVNRRIGFVPTMGALHEGHLSLGRKARNECDCLIYSIFVNPIQFGPKEDLARYPRDLKGDLEKLESIGTDAVFFPDETIMYPEGYSTYIDVGPVGNVLCGKTRPGHFSGVATVVTKLFNITGCDQAYFGKKDYQQYTILKKVVNELNMPVDIIGVDTVREKDGLAMSSRNSYLSKDERKAAVVLNKTLKFVKDNFIRFKTKSEILTKVTELISSEKLADIEYAELRNASDLSDIRSIKKNKLVLLLAVRFGTTRLIDNMIVN